MGSLGASPRARGNRVPARPQRARDGCIPACAGEPDPGLAERCHAWVHPRVRGGTRAFTSNRSFRGGASPRARGNRDQPRGRALRSGCIPACAGEPFSHLLKASCSWVHPRVRGGTVRPGPGTQAAPGASPRARGNHPGLQHAAGLPGVHPRVRGGTVNPTVSAPKPLGASPRARGNLLVVEDRVGRRGCIPACAGEPPRRSATGPGSTVHPRVRGGTKPGNPVTRRSRGASPRARGNRGVRRLLALLQGCIPACAGEPGPMRPDADR